MPLASQLQVMQAASTLLRALHVCWLYHHVHKPRHCPWLADLNTGAALRGVWLHRLAQVLPDTCGMCHVPCLTSEHVVSSLVTSDETRRQVGVANPRPAEA